MPTGSHEDLQIKQDDKFFSRLMSKEASTANSSARVYYGGASGAVPFLWELQPGTPKHPSAHTTLPPLTPPPSYYCNPKSKSIQNNKNRKTNLMGYILRFPCRWKNHMETSSSSSFSSSSPSSSVTSYGSSPLPSMTNMNRKLHKRDSFPVCTRSVDVVCGVVQDDEEEGCGLSPTSTLCFGVKVRRGSLKLGFQGCYSKSKNTLMSIVSPSHSLNN
ncbi:hypothetical protein SLEP1_g5175 [Rubroshorea leprosula]|uniref:Uncharacterized protein n=1 Tax=Rubroshorea leprosula TaxID=152421 RepID=A0AAV5HZ04_9ROSI|nr:hypothetical protein SLEP1_g5175 [Rubroshorea leprosula]